LAFGNIVFFNTEIKPHLKFNRPGSSRDGFLVGKKECEGDRHIG
jgi:hypothetical protein